MNSPARPPPPATTNVPVIASADLGVLSAWAPQLAEAFVSLSSDIALVLDPNGVVLKVAQGGASPMAPSAQDWVGRAWVDTVTGETRAKVDLLLKDVTSTGFARRREVNHPSTTGVDIPVAYTAMRLGEQGPLLVVGRDLRAVAAIQQRFVDAQRELERGYWRTRQAEARYRQLFQVANDAVLIVDAESMCILEANQAAAALFDMAVAQLQERLVTAGFEQRSRGAVEELLSTSRRLGQSAEIRVRLSGRKVTTHVAATPFRADDAMRLLVRVRPVDMPEAPADRSAALARLVDAATESIVITDSSGRILAANPAFQKLVQADSESELKQRSLQDWIAGSEPALDALIAKVHKQGITRRQRARIRRPDASLTTVEVSAALLAEGDQENIGFTLRELSPATAALHTEIPDGADGLGAAVERVAARLEQVGLPGVLREIALLVEQHAIGHALHRSRDEAAAARVLGISGANLSRRRRRLLARRSVQGEVQTEPPP